jgi:hypothetical protein
MSDHEFDIIHKKHLQAIADLYTKQLPASSFCPNSTSNKLLAITTLQLSPPQRPFTSSWSTFLKDVDILDKDLFEGQDGSLLFEIVDPHLTI